MPTVDIPAQRIDPTGPAAGVKRFRGELSALRVSAFDWPLMLAAFGLVVFSLITISGATKNDIPGSPHYYVLRQSIYAMIGIGLMFAIARFDYERLRDFRTQIYVFLVSSIVLVLLVGAAAKGSRRWITVGGFQAQPSELGKVLLVVVLAAFIVDRARDRNTARVSLSVIGLAALPALLVFLQPDLGSALVYGAIAMTVLFIGGAPWGHMAVLFASVAAITVLVLALAPAAGVNVLKSYQVDRLTGFLHPSDDPAGQTYQQTQAQIAIGAGGRTGRGVAGATQTKLNFVPEHHTDFIFAVVGESFGFAGAATVLSLYALLLWRVLRIITGARDMFGMLIAAGMFAILVFQIFVNVGMNVGIMPITGVTLPLMSVGGSSLIVTFIALGLLQSIAVRSYGVRAGGASTI